MLVSGHPIIGGWPVLCAASNVTGDVAVSDWGRSRHRCPALLRTHTSWSQKALLRHIMTLWH